MKWFIVALTCLVSLTVAQYPAQGPVIARGTITTNVTVLSATDLQFNVTCTDDGYMSIGWTTGTTSHIASDMIVGWMTTTAAGTVVDTYSNSFARPTQDASPDVTYVSAQKHTTGFTIIFNRKYDTGDTNQDVAITNQANLLYQWASKAQTVTNLGSIQTHTSRGSVPNVNFLDATPIANGNTNNNQPQNGEFKTNGFQCTFKADATKVVFTMSSDKNPSYVALSISPNGAAMDTHSDSDTYIGYMSTAGLAMVSDGYSSSVSRPVPDAQQDAKDVTGSSVGGTLTISFSRLLDSNDASDKKIENINYQMGWAIGPTGASATPDTFVNHGASDTTRGGFVANLITGAGGTANRRLNPGTQYAVTLSVLVVFYSLIRMGYKYYKVRKQQESKNMKVFMDGPAQTVTINSPNTTAVEVGEDFNYDTNFTENYYFRGSVAVKYADEIREGAAMAAEAKQEAPARPTSAELDPQKQVGSKWAVLGHKITHYRLPKSQISIGDLLIAIGFLFLNIGFAVWWKAEGFTPGLTWGYLAAANSFFVALPATRNSVLVWLLGLPFDKTIMFHRWLGRWLWIQVVVHWAYYGPDTGAYGQTYWTGFGGWVFMSVILATSEGYVRRKYFNVFYYTHFIFFAFYLITCYHSMQSFLPFTYAALFFYGLDRVLRLFWGAWPTKTVRIEVIAGAVRVVFKKHCVARYQVGQYVFLNFPGIEFLEWHPFTLASGPDEEHLEVLIKGLGDHTKKLIAAAEANQQLWIRVDGPYGKWPFNFTRFKAVVMVAGGVGVTPSMSLIRHVFNINRKGKDVDTHLTDVFFVWSCKNEREYHWYKEMLEEAMKRSALQSKDYPTLHTYVHITQPTGDGELSEYVRAGRVNFDATFGRVDQLVPAGENLRVAVIACGPAALVNDTWDQTSKRTGGTRRFDFHHETFDF